MTEKIWSIRGNHVKEIRYLKNKLKIKEDELIKVMSKTGLDPLTKHEKIDVIKSECLRITKSIKELTIKIELINKKHFKKENGNKTINKGNKGV